MRQTNDNDLHPFILFCKLITMYFIVYCFSCALRMQLADLNSKMSKVYQLRGQIQKSAFNTSQFQLVLGGWGILVARVTRVFQLAVLIFALISALRKQVSCSVFRRSLFESDFFPIFDESGKLHPITSFNNFCELDALIHNYTLPPFFHCADRL